MTLSEADLDAIKTRIDAALTEGVPRMVAAELEKAKPPPPVGAIADDKKLQIDYAWKWFVYHADQRIKMFNYMLLTVGIFATAVVGAVTNGFVYAAVVACVCAAALLFAFSRLDRRNRDLVRLGEDLLRQMEESALFAGREKFGLKKLETERMALLRRQDDQDDAKGSNAIWGGRHRFWLPAIAYGLAVVFLVSAAWLFCNAGLFAKPAPVIKMPDSMSVRLLPSSPGHE